VRHTARLRPTLTKPHHEMTFSFSPLTRIERFYYQPSSDGRSPIADPPLKGSQLIR
jgi:hypothetical protein